MIIKAREIKIELKTAAREEKLSQSTRKGK
jgi:hypothetical protein